MDVVTAPNTTIENEYSPSVFLAGGITNCPDWQKEFIKSYKGQDCTIFNPRRAVWDNERFDDSISIEQIEWEKNYLDECDGVVFWFPEETLCPITLFELGAALYSKDIIAIGIHPNYKRRLDVEIQTKLVDNRIPIVYSIGDLVSTVEEFVNNF